MEFYCSPRESPVLMIDFTEKPIEQIKIGDMVVGFEQKAGKNQHTKLVPSRVITYGKRRDWVHELELESGNAIRCTSSHLWYTGRADGEHSKYLPASFKKRYALSGLIPVPELKTIDLPKEKERAAGWLGGMYDGEGSIYTKNMQMIISQSETHNPEVRQQLRVALRELGFDWSERQVLSEERCMLNFCIKGGMREIIRFLGWCAASAKISINGQYRFKSILFWVCLK